MPPLPRGHESELPMRPRIVPVLLAAGAASLPSVAHAQGCIIGRQCTPGAVGRQSFVMPGQADFTLNYRTFVADRHYNGTVYQEQRQRLNNYVVNRQNLWDLTATIGKTNRSNLIVSIPWINSGWSIPRPIGSDTQTPGPRSQQNGNGLGDISASWRTWLRDPETAGPGNLAVSLGIKLPTGNARETNVLPDRDGQNFQPRIVDQSIQPGDGSYGFPVGVEGYRKIKDNITVFGTVNYLVSPRDTNGVPSGRTVTATAPSIGVFSVPDQYLYRLGVGGAIPTVPGLSAALAWRKEGVPQKDLIGGHHGWRRPGYSVSIEPSVSYVRSDTTWNLAVPLTTFRNRVPHLPDGTEIAGDSTFADYQIILSVTKRTSFR